MNTINHLKDFGLDEESVRRGEVVELDTMTPQAAKKAKLDTVSPAQDAADILEAYAADMATTVQSNEDLSQQNGQLQTHLSQVTQENGDLKQAMDMDQTASQRIQQLSTTMDQMEASLHESLAANEKQGQTLTQLQQANQDLQAQNDQLRQELAECQADKDNAEQALHSLQDTQEQTIQDLSDKQAQEMAHYDQFCLDLEQKVNQVLTSFLHYVQAQGIAFEPPFKYPTSQAHPSPTEPPQTETDPTF